MFRTWLFSTPRGILATCAAVGIAVAVGLASLSGEAISADKYSVKVPGGLAFSEFRGI